MTLALRLDPNRLRQWHVRLAARLARRGPLRVEFGVGSPLPASVALLLGLERIVHRIPTGDAAVASRSEFAKFAADGEVDLTIDFTGEPPRGRSWRVTFDGGDDAALPGALLNGRTPVVAISDAATNEVIVSGHPGTETAGIFTLALTDVLARTATLIEAALDGAGTRVVAAARPQAISAKKAAIFATKSLARLAVRTVYRWLYNSPHWRVGWRRVDGTDVVDLKAHPDSGWRELPDDRTRFYADPFPFEHEGRTFVFVEDFPHKLGYGLISVVEFDENGPVGTPRPVLDIGTHLSYPFVFAHGDAIYMIPETCATRTVDLYRAEEFPGRWVKYVTLLSDIAASDATVFEYNGRWWMLATVHDGGAFSDALHVWSAPDLLRPWTAHRRNPVLVDIATARPAGRVVTRDGKLIRPFQDCRDGYGAALGLAEITRLDDEAFEQRVETVLRAGPLWRGSRLHTLNRAGRLECIDGSATARRF